MPYCSLICFRSEPHGECSESFYKKEIESGIKTEASKTAEERMKMLELLKKFEEESPSLEDLEDEDEDSDEDEDELSRRMRGLDIDNVAVDDLWAMLNPEERQKFLRALSDEDSELAQALLASEELEKSQQLPWWERPVVVGDEPPEASSSRKRYGVEPSMAPIPTSLLKATPQGHRLSFNLAAISIAYAYLTRTLRVSPLSAVDRDSADHVEIKRLVSQLIPFITERNSTMVYEDIQSVKRGLWARLGADSMERTQYTALLQDASCLIRPNSVVLIGSEDDDTKNHAHRRLVLLVSDLWGVYEGGAANKVNAAAQKLLYYGAQALSLDSNVLRRIAAELARPTL